MNTDKNKTIVVTLSQILLIFVVIADHVSNSVVPCLQPLLHLEVSHHVIELLIVDAAISINIGLL